MSQRRSRGLFEEPEWIPGHLAETDEVTDLLRRMRALNRFAALSRVRRTAADRQRVARAAARLRAL
ncbi:hypothetical protein HL658_36245, partial [Azospirillum sp. RWY-5-1]|uniref:hypothetical protein n=1 Tax=Azospirillum oleiclasticum TaxID=2735135 RepID=UPI0015D4C0E3